MEMVTDELWLDELIRLDELLLKLLCEELLSVVLDSLLLSLELLRLLVELDETLLLFEDELCELRL